MSEQRMIDANRLKHVLDINFGGFGGAAVLAQMIDEQPTAYDVDKIVEQLEELSKYEVVEKKFEKAIEIVKGGAV